MRECQARRSRLLPLEESSQILWAPPVSAVWISRDGDFPFDERGQDFVCSIRERKKMTSYQHENQGLLSTSYRTSKGRGEKG
ncbi:hypothetical protein TNCV_2034151 [Trichonephila clavipes]|nr:hypothetical protein TNCV_2034151 [Trichonephila clavipes]